jgi:phage/plasmid-like protein (TIGR03299 family)
MHGITSYETDEGAVENAVYVRTPAWHRLGTVVQDELTVREALDAANLDATVTKVPLIATVGGDQVEVEGQYLTVRNNPVTGTLETLGIVGDDYKVIQNVDALSFFDNILDQAEASIQSAGELFGGSQIFVSMRVGDDIVIDPDGAGDRVSTHLIGTTSHDGSVPLTALFASNRVDCANMLAMALDSAKSKYRLRHTSKAELDVAEARKVLDMHYKLTEAFEAEATALFQTEITSQEFMNIIKAAYPEPDEAKKGAVTRWTNKVDLITDLYEGGGDVEFTNAAITGTAWGALNAMTERLDHHRNGRGEGSEQRVLEASAGFGQGGTLLNKEKSRLRSIVLDVAREIKPALFV